MMIGKLRELVAKVIVIWCPVSGQRHLSIIKIVVIYTCMTARQRQYCGWQKTRLFSLTMWRWFSVQPNTMVVIWQQSSVRRTISDVRWRAWQKPLNFITVDRAGYSCCSSCTKRRVLFVLPAKGWPVERAAYSEYLAKMLVSQHSWQCRQTFDPVKWASMSSMS